MLRRPALWALLCSAVVLWSVCFPLTATDIWWHLAAGRLMVEGRQLLFHDPFSADVTNTPWIDLHWLFQVVAYTVFSLGGVRGLVLIKALVVGLSAGLLVLLASRHVASRWLPLAAALVAGSIHCARHLVLVRPIVVTLLCITLFLLVLERFRRRGRPRVLLLLLPLEVLWANCQGLYYLGPAMVAAYLVGDLIEPLLQRRGAAQPDDRRKARRLGPLVILLPTLVLCGLVTPYGPDGLRLPFVLLSRIDPAGSQLFAQNISENVPPWTLERTGLPPPEVIHFRWIAVLTFATFLPLMRAPSALARLLLVGGLFALALLANRNILLFNWVAGPVAAINVGLLLERVVQARPLAVSLAPGLAAAVALAGLAGLAWHRQLGARDEPPISSIAPFRVPVEAVARLQELALASGTLFNSVRYGGYLAFKLHPRARPIIDGRLVLRRARQVAEHLELVDEPSRFERFRRAHGIRTVLLPAASPDRYLRLVARLYADPAWLLLYTDGTQTLFVHGETPLAPAARAVDLHSRATVQRTVAGLRRRWLDIPAVLERASLHLARLLAEVGELRRAAEVLEALSVHEARSLLARVLYLEQQPDRALQMARKLLRLYGDNPDDLTLLALIAVDHGRHEEAVRLVQRALEMNPYHSQARQVLARIRRELAPDTP